MAQAPSAEPLVVNQQESKPEDKAWGIASFKEKFGEVSLFANSVSFGRNKKSEIKVNHPHASGTHCTLRRNEGGIIFLDDTSTNGTWVNGKLVGKGKTVYISHGDTVHVVRPSKVDNEEIAFTVLMMNAKASRLVGPDNRYDIGRQLGSGTFASVHMCLDTTTGTKYAVKILDKKRLQNGQPKNPKGPMAKRGLLEEVKILQKLDHPNIIKVYDAFESADGEQLYVILELVKGGDLLDKMIEMGEEFPEDHARAIFMQIVTSVQYLHTNGVVHRDLKPENILLVDKASEQLKLTDFGLSRVVGEKSFMQTICGTPMYVAPEVVSGMGKDQNKGYGKEVDVWSMGVILYMLLCGEPPFDQRKQVPILEQVKKGTYSMPEDLQASLSKDAQDLVAKMICVDPKARATIDDILKHPWINKEESKQEPKGKGKSARPSSAVNEAMGAMASLRLGFSSMASQESNFSFEGELPPSVGGGPS